MRSAAALIVLLTGCGASHAAAEADAGGANCFLCFDAGDAGLPGEIKGTLRLTCAVGGVELACHGVGSGGMTLGTANDFAQIVNVPSTERPGLVRVAPGRPSDSYLYLKLVGDGGIDGAPMPGGMTDPRLVALFGAWIEAGAPSQ
jgi:hypothetical protein